MSSTPPDTLPASLVLCSLCRFYLTSATFVVLWPGCWWELRDGRVVHGPWSGYLCGRCRGVY